MIISLSDLRKNHPPKQKQSVELLGQKDSTGELDLKIKNKKSTTILFLMSSLFTPYKHLQVKATTATKSEIIFT